MKRKDRVENFIEGRTSVMVRHLRPQLLMSTFCLLKQSLWDRRAEGIHKTADNHYSEVADGVILLAFQSLEVWVNSAIVHKHFGATPEELRKQLKLANENLPEKMAEILPGYQRQGDIELFNEIRNEITHFLPRNYGEEDWCQTLINQGLIFAHADLPFNSYKLAYWCVELLVDAGRSVADMLEAAGMPGSGMKANFVIPSDINSPNDLSVFDAANNIKVH